MFRALLFTLATALTVVATGLGATEPPAATAVKPAVSFSIVRTAKVSVMEGLLYSGGSVTDKVDTNFSAFLIRHGSSTLLLDTGLGRQVAEQYQQDMPIWLRLFFRYEDPVLTARQQLDSAGIGPIQTIFLTHSHWDHASGVTDFPEATIWASAPEMEMIRHPRGGIRGSWSSQVGAKSTQWASLDFKSGPYESFDASLDVFDDGSLVLVPLFGHTPGSIGLFVTVDSGKRYFFIGDAVWAAKALTDSQPKFLAARVLVDQNAEQTQHVIEQIHALIARYPDLVVVPAHDGTVQNALGYFPAWVK